MGFNTTLEDSIFVLGFNTTLKDSIFVLGFNTTLKDSIFVLGFNTTLKETSLDVFEFFEFVESYVGFTTTCDF